MDRWDWIVILAAGYVCVTALIRLMALRRNQVVEHIRDEIEKQVNGKAGDQKQQEASDEDRDAA